MYIFNTTKPKVWPKEMGMLAVQGLCWITIVEVKQLKNTRSGSTRILKETQNNSHLGNQDYSQQENKSSPGWPLFATTLLFYYTKNPWNYSAEAKFNFLLSLTLHISNNVLSLQGQPRHISQAYSDLLHSTVILATQGIGSLLKPLNIKSHYTLSGNAVCPLLFPTHLLDI